MASYKNKGHCHLSGDFKHQESRIILWQKISYLFIHRN